jgi:hypothetical protein
MRREAIRAIYSDPDIVRYVCPGGGNCDINEFSQRLDIKTILLNAKGVKGIQIEPLNKGSQFFLLSFFRNSANINWYFHLTLRLAASKF